MSKKFVCALSGGAVLLLALSGCGDDNDAKVNDWAKTFCGDIKPDVDKINASTAAIDKQTADTSKPAEVQKTDSKAFQDLSTAYKGLARSLDQAGAPPVDNGEDIKKDVVRELNASSASYAKLKKTVDGLDTGNQAKFADGLKDVAGQLAKISQGSNAALNELQSGDVAKAMKNQKNCQKASPSPSVPNASPSA
ncbi:hypothetical protein [Streptomyces sp. SPB074]|uniref:hypothetical protein n=1 Tax=Streptomyces sp. (strain SPB074) TaxID=465543 RepID=UPI00017F1940|nr:hypothetical protein [Streptomyces sp. SPB074]EDY43000.1 secreted protein [Streptomyces sp. SPB074]